MIKKYLAYISPAEDITGKEYVCCNVVFITGDLDHRTIQGVYLKTDIFRYYYFGSTLEVIELDEKQNIVGIHDLAMEETKEFGVSLYYIRTLNKTTFDMLATNDFVYNLKVNKFYNYCKSTVENMVDALQKAECFVMWAYVINGAIVYVELEDNPRNNNQYIMTEGYVVADKSRLRAWSHAESGATADKNEKLKQADIDKLITRLIG